MNTQHVAALRQARAKAHHDAIDYLKAGLTAENRTAYDAAMSDVERLASEIRSAENGGRENPMALATREARKTSAEVSVAFDRYLRFGLDSLTVEQRRVLSTRAEKRVQEAGTITITQSEGSAGGYFVPAEFQYEIDQATKYYCPLLDGTIALVIRTDSGAVLPFPTGNDTTNVAQLVGESGTVTEQDFALGVVNFNAYKYTSQIVKVTSELMQDSAFDIYEYLAQRFGERFGRAFETAFTTGAGGGSAPTGFLTAIANGGGTPVIANGSNPNDGSGNTGANSIGSQDIVNLEHAVDPSYRRKAKYVLHDKSLGFLQGLLDKYGRPLWTPGVANNAPDMINGYEYVIDQAMPQIGASNVTVAFGDFSKFVIRVVSQPVIKRLVELYAANDEVGFLAFQRVDSNVVDAGLHPIAVLQQHS